MTTRESQSWPVQDAKARFSEFLDSCLSDGPQIVTRRGKEEAVLVPISEWRRLSRSGGPSFKDILLGDGPRFDLPEVRRLPLRRRPPPQFD